MSSTTNAGPPDDPTAGSPSEPVTAGSPSDPPIAGPPGGVPLDDLAGGHPPAVPRGAGARWWSGPVVLAAMVIGGVPLGVAWSMLAPWIPVVNTEQGAAVRGADPEYFVAADGWFGLLGLGFGVVAAVLAWALLPRLRGPVGLLAVTFGGLGAAGVAWALGRQIGLAGYRQALESAELGAQLSRPPDLQAGDFDLWFGVLPAITGAFGAPAFGAALAYTLLAGWSRYPSLRPEPEPGAESGPGPELGAGPERGYEPASGSERPVSSGSPAPPTPATGSAPPAPGAAVPPPD
ncbi:DUF2567 domain-containing protein [Micromonospora sp. NBC_01813]|uniref:DUF2567 domain-containing protein n=1 Tax=Micromonospora sp. NBC_01813 TaxID=2975988 RepID=UPI002DD7B3A7|nr:DUF2567 domain-containing protein [Micromonospora sp. NBC_01813]WSA09698.1 DUF2567 domain-containing protein [Micromonospora sp. NBC_01813]